MYRQVSACLEQMLLDLQKENLCQAEDVWQWIQGRFEESRDEYEVLLEETGQEVRAYRVISQDRSLNMRSTLWRPGLAAVRKWFCL